MNWTNHPPPDAFASYAEIMKYLHRFCGTMAVQRGTHLTVFNPQNPVALFP